MDSKAKLFDRNNIDTLKWPDTPEGKQAYDLLLPMIEEGVEAYIKNVATRLYLLQVDEHILPLTVNEREYDNSYLTSNYFAIKYLEERIEQRKSFVSYLQKPLIKGLGLLLKAIKINKAVIVNNWLLTTNIYPDLNNQQLEAVTGLIKNRFPDHAIVFRSLNVHRCIDLATYLEKQRYRLVGSRFVYIYDPEQKGNFSSKVFYHHRRDRRLIKSEGYEVIDNETVQPHEFDHLLSLYNHIYISRHTKYSPQYTEKFLKRAVERRFFNLIGLKKEGEVQGVMGCYVRNGTMTIPFFGYDTKKGGPNHLYRMLTILAIDEAEKGEWILNDGNGGSGPKKYRGMKPFPEYVALYDRHLPLHRRLFWGFAEKMVNWIAFPFIKKRVNRYPNSRK